MMEDPTAHNDEDEDYKDEEEGEKDTTLRRLSYLFNLPTEIKISCTSRIPYQLGTSIYYYYYYNVFIINTSVLLKLLG